MKIAIAGYGAEGHVNYRYWNTPGNEVVIVDEREIPIEDIPEGAVTLLGEGSFSQLSGFDMVVRTAGLAPSKIITDGKIWSATNEFFNRCPAPIIGVTGTKGKGTVSSLIASILRAGGKNVHLVGNIGTPALDEIEKITPEDIVVYELSSFQLWDLQKSPHVAVVLMIEPDHLDVHASYEEYIAAKAHITEYQDTTDRVVHHPENEASIAIAKKSVGQLLPYGTERTAHVRDDYFYYHDNELCLLDELQLAGVHNQENACAAITAVWPWVQDPAVIAEGLRSFDGLPHRLKFVADVNGVSYYDDSIATTPGSAIAALRAFSQPKIIILGGSDKGVPYDEVVRICQESHSRVIAVGQTGKTIQELCQEYGVECERVEGSMADAVQKAHDMASVDDVVILSPASASFDQYKNYADRGEQFIEAVNALHENGHRR